MSPSFPEPQSRRIHALIRVDGATTKVTIGGN